MVTVVGMGPGGEEYLLPLARQAILDADAVYGHERWKEAMNALGCSLITSTPLQGLVDSIKGRAGDEDVAVLVSGDPGLFSLLATIRSRMPAIECRVIPGISAAQVLFARLGRGWEGVTFLSLHGRNSEVLSENVRPGAKICILTDQKNDPGAIGGALTAMGVRGLAVVGENLTLARERIVETTIEKLSDEFFESLALVYLEIDQDA